MDWAARWGVLGGVVLGVGLVLLERWAPARLQRWLPSPIGLGLAFVLPASFSVSLFLGALAAALLARARPKAAESPGAEPWTLAGAALVDATGEQVELARWHEAPIPANGAGAIVVGIEEERAQLGCPCTLKLWEATGPRIVTLGNVTLPEGKANGP